MTTPLPVWYNDLSRDFMRDYLQGQTIQERIEGITQTFKNFLSEGMNEFLAEEYSSQFKDYLNRGFISLSSPVWSNYGSTKGTPISCFGSNIEDSIESLAAAQAEITMMSKSGGGTSAVVAMRPKGSPISIGGTANGPVYYLSLIQENINKITQGNTRRGHCAVSMDVGHPDIMEFLEIRSEGHEIQDLSFGATIPEGWMQEMQDGDPHKRKVWAKILEKRSQIGYPYVAFLDNMNRGAADVYKYNPHYRILHSNMCQEISLPNNQDESFVCCLSSANLARYDEWKDTNLIEVMVFFLDTVLTDFIQKAKKIKFMDRAVRFAERHRAIGIGQLGWHTYLQSKYIAFESDEAFALNLQISKQIYEQAYHASERLADWFGPCEVSEELLSRDLAPEGFKPRRNATLTAIAPTKSSAFILGQVSESTEPWQNNYFIDDKAKKKHSLKNPHLLTLLEDKGMNTDAVWESILKNHGSVQHLEGLTPKEKEVFKTFSEINQFNIIKQAADRQKWLDQSQSLNTMVHPATPPREISNLYIEAWRLGIKTLYYQKSINAAQAFSLELMNECAACSI
jgi:ribonucleoside-diphosphate reductase alpha chain